MGLRRTAHTCESADVCDSEVRDVRSLFGNGIQVFRLKVDSSRVAHSHHDQQ